MPKHGQYLWGEDQVKVQTRVPRELYTQLREEAHRLGISIPRLMVELVAKQCEFPLSEWQG